MTGPRPGEMSPGVDGRPTTVDSEAGELLDMQDLVAADGGVERDMTFLVAGFIGDLNPVEAAYGQYKARSDWHERWEAQNG